MKIKSPALFSFILCFLFFSFAGVGEAIRYRVPSDAPKKCKGKPKSTADFVKKMKCYIKEKKKELRRLKKSGASKKKIQQIQKRINKADDTIDDATRDRFKHDFSGTWATNLGYSVTFTHFTTSDAIAGSWLQDGVNGSLSGFVLGRTASGTWNWNNQSGTFSVKMSRDATSFAGTCVGPWTGIRQ